jgi:hypothetical protein
VTTKSGVVGIIGKTTAALHGWFSLPFYYFKSTTKKTQCQDEFSYFHPDERIDGS